MDHPEPAPALPDILDHGLSIVFCGINPGVDAAAAGHHFVGRGNRFWQVLHLAGLTPHRVRAQDDAGVLRYGLGLTAAAARPTPHADQVAQEEFTRAAPALLRKLALYRPQCIAFLGKAAYLALTGRRHADWGEQAQLLCGARVWLLPNPSGRNRGFSLDRLVQAYAALRLALPVPVPAP